jgi:hypothetical protein
MRFNWVWTLAAYFLFGLWVRTEPARDLISRGLTLFGFCKAFEAMLPTFEPDFSFATVSYPLCSPSPAEVAGAGT